MGRDEYEIKLKLRTRTVFRARSLLVDSAVKVYFGTRTGRGPLVLKKSGRVILGVLKMTKLDLICAGQVHVGSSRI